CAAVYVVLVAVVARLDPDRDYAVATPDWYAVARDAVLAGAAALAGSCRLNRRTRMGAAVARAVRVARVVRVAVAGWVAWRARELAVVVAAVAVDAIPVIAFFS